MRTQANKYFVPAGLSGAVPEIDAGELFGGIAFGLLFSTVTHSLLFSHLHVMGAMSVDISRNPT